MNNLQPRYQSGELTQEEYIQALEQRLAEAEMNIQALVNAQVDAVLENGQTMPLLMRQAQLSLMRSRETLERRVAEHTRELEESQAFIQRILDITPAIIYLFDVEKRHSIYYNRQMTNYLGYSNQELEGTTGYQPEVLMHPDDLPKLQEHVNCLISSPDGQVSTIQYRMRDKQGNWRWFLAQDVVFKRTPNGKAQQILGSAMDITERKQAEKAINDYANQLEQLNLELAYTNRELKYANRELKDFAYIASHDLQEPLRKVIQFGQRLRDRYRPDFDAEGQDFLDRMVKSTRRMQDMLNGLLDYSRTAAQGSSFARVELEQAIREALLDLEYRIEQTDGQIEFGPLPVIEADPLQMRQLMLNLIGNALKFHKPEVPPQIKVWVDENQEKELPEGYVKINVQDNGIGFEPEFASKIFLPFMRLHSRNEFEGTGMGLAICRKIAVRHGGDISVTSSPGDGTTFTITLPRLQRNKMPQPSDQ